MWIGADFIPAFQTEKQKNLLYKSVDFSPMMCQEPSPGKM